MSHSGQVWAIVAAAGRGVRFGKPYNKVFHLLNGRSILSRCMDALCAADAFDGIALVLSSADFETYHALAEREGKHSLIKAVVAGGNDRSASVMRGLSAIPEDAEIVAVHDAARPFVSPKVIHACIAAARDFGSGVPATPVTDTIKRVNAKGFAVETLERDALRAVQTPQVFSFDKLVHAYQNSAGLRVTDDASLYEHIYGSVKLVEMNECLSNVKITTQNDMMPEKTAERIRVGTGYDVHRLTAGRKLILCGVEIPHDFGLAGHSDADVAVHALMDGLLGAMALGDIGRHFPDNDPAYKDISSMKLLSHVCHLMKTNNLRLINADITIVAQRPKLASYMDAMVHKIADALSVNATCINVKATTTEGLGFEGEAKGISAHAIVSLSGVNIF